ncbi:MAG TPA: TorF family putative porin, partial [Burkholderiales bacterium]|nr:TorF family putative porin [Burkholderiales bacterium]
MIKKTVIAGALAAALTPGLVSAQQAPAPASPHTLTGNLGLYSQYIFRGLTQTDKDPALQGGFDYSHSSGLYAGTWGSNISWLRDFGSYSGGGSLEWDFYGGFKGNIGKSDFTYDLGALYYWYPGDVAPGFVKADTLELYGALGWKWVSIKYSHSAKNKTFGVPDSRGTYYLDVTASVPLGNSGVTAIAHWGRQKFDGQTPGLAFDNDTLYSYEDW